MHEFDGASLGRRLAEFRAARRLSLQDVADAAGLSKAHVWELEAGRARNPTVGAVWKLSRALAVSPAALLGLDDAMPPIHEAALRIALIADEAIRARSLIQETTND